MLKVPALTNLEMSSGVNSFQAFSIHSTITQCSRDFRFPASVSSLISSMNNHSSYSSETLALNYLFHGPWGAWIYFIHLPGISKDSIFFCFKLFLTESSIWQWRVSQTSRHLEKDRESKTFWMNSFVKDVYKFLDQIRLHWLFHGFWRDYWQF